MPMLRSLTSWCLTSCKCYLSGTKILLVEITHIYPKKNLRVTKEEWLFIGNVVSDQATLFLKCDFKYHMSVVSFLDSCFTIPAVQFQIDREKYYLRQANPSHVGFCRSRGCHLNALVSPRMLCTFMLLFFFQNVTLLPAIASAALQKTQLVLTA